MSNTNILKSFFAKGPYERILSDIQKISKASANFIIWGESGTGKNLIAYLSHTLSPRTQGPYVEIDCSSFPETLIETELFGYTRGSFTGAEKDHPGRFALAHKGTLVLDNLDNLSIRAQAKLLKVIESGKYTPMGSYKELSINTKFIAILQNDPQKLIESNIIRKDLYYRISIFTIKTPSTRELSGTLKEFIYFIVEKESKRIDMPPISFSENALNILSNYGFPGNVRELQNLIRKWTYLLPGQQLSAKDVKIELKRRSVEESFESLEEIEKSHIKKVLHATNGHLGKAAKILKIHRKTLLEKRKKYSIDRYGNDI